MAKNGFVSAPKGVVIVWFKTNQCPAGFIKATEIADNVFLKFANMVDLNVVAADLHSHDAYHYHSQSHYHAPYVASAYDFLGGPIWCTSPGPDQVTRLTHTHRMTTNTDTTGLGIAYDQTGNNDVAPMPPYVNALHCRRY